MPYVAVSDGPVDVLRMFVDLLPLPRRGWVMPLPLRVHMLAVFSLLHDVVDPFCVFRCEKFLFMQPPRRGWVIPLPLRVHIAVLSLLHVVVDRLCVLLREVLLHATFGRYWGFGAARLRP